MRHGISANESIIISPATNMHFFQPPSQSSQPKHAYRFYLLSFDAVALQSPLLLAQGSSSASPSQPLPAAEKARATPAAQLILRQQKEVVYKALLRKDTNLKW